MAEDDVREAVRERESSERWERGNAREEGAWERMM